MVFGLNLLMAGDCYVPLIRRPVLWLAFEATDQENLEQIQQLFKKQIHLLDDQIRIAVLSR